MRGVLLTRPRATSEALAQEVARLGYAPVSAPLLTIVRTRLPLPPAPYQAVMITSGNVFKTLPDKDFLSFLLSLPCFCVGLRTAEKARAFGFRDVHHADADGAALAAFMTTRLADKDRPILHIAGLDVDSKAQNQLRANGFRIAVWPVYAAKPVADLPPEAVAFMQSGDDGAILVFSPRTAQTLTDLLTRHALEIYCPNKIVIGLSEAVLKPLSSFGWNALYAATLPTESAVLDCLKRHQPIA